MFKGSGDADVPPSPSGKQDILVEPSATSAAVQADGSDDVDVCEAEPQRYENGLTVATVCELLKTEEHYSGHFAMENLTDTPYGFIMKAEHPFLHTKFLNYGIIPPMTTKTLTVVCPDEEWKVEALKNGHLRIFAVALPAKVKNLLQHMEALLKKYPVVGEMYKVSLMVQTRRPFLNRAQNRFSVGDYAWFLFATFLFFVAMGRSPVHFSIFGMTRNSSNSGSE